jgi:hypothetical protein
LGNALRLRQWGGPAAVGARHAAGRRSASGTQPGPRRRAGRTVGTEISERTDERQRQAWSETTIYPPAFGAAEVVLGWGGWRGGPALAGRLMGNRSALV